MTIAYAANPPTDVATQLFTLSGLSTQIQYIPEIIESEVVSVLENEKENYHLSRRTVQQYVDVLRKCYAVEKLSDVILNDLTKQFTYQNTQIIIQWLQSRLGQHFTFLEKRSTQPEQMVKMGEYVLNLSTSPLSEERWNLVVQLSRAVLAQDSTLQVLMAQKLAINLTQSQFQTTKTKPTLNSIIERMTQQRSIIEQEISNLVIYGLLFTYQTATNHDLQAYLKFARSNAGKVYHKRLLDAYNHALMDAGICYAQALRQTSFANNINE